MVGLYLNPPEQAIVLCVDEKSQIQALDRTQPWLPIKKGRAATMTHDYKRNGTTTLFAALEVVTGRVIGECLPRHRASEFVKFLDTIDAAVPTGLEVHVILDNYATHKHATVTRWLACHPRVRFHFTPTSSSWLNLVERWFRELTDKALRRGVFGSVPDLITAIEDYLAAHNNNPRPLVWTATAESILIKVARGRVTLNRETKSGTHHSFSCEHLCRPCGGDIGKEPPVVPDHDPLVLGSLLLNTLRERSAQQPHVAAGEFVTDDRPPATGTEVDARHGMALSCS